MTIQDGIIAFLTASPYPLPQVEDRVYFGHGPVEPVAGAYIVIYPLSREPMHTHSGVTSIKQRAFQFSIFADVAGDAFEIARALDKLLDGYKGLMGTVQVCAVFFQADRLVEEQSRLEHASADYQFQWIDQ